MRLRLSLLLIPLLAACSYQPRERQADIAFQPLISASCGDYLTARQAERYNKEFAYMFSGYVSAANHMVSITVPEWTLKDRFKNNIVDISGGLSAAGQLEWMDRYCEKNREKSVQQGLYVITNQMLADYKLERYFLHIAR